MKPLVGKAQEGLGRTRENHGAAPNVVNRFVIHKHVRLLIWLVSIAIHIFIPVCSTSGLPVGNQQT